MVNSFEFNGHEIALLCIVAENASTHLVSLDGFEERFKITLAEALIFLALNELKEDRPDGFSEKICSRSRGSPSSVDPSSRMPRRSQLFRGLTVVSGSRSSSIS